VSANTDSYWKKIQDLEANPVGAYQSRWQSQLDNALNAITNRKAFNYDFNADPMYQAYKDQYTKLGKEASMNAAANAAALTGGYGNSYAVTAGAQANQQYLTQLNNIIPELYNLAMNRYKMEGDELNNKYAVLGDADDRDYGRHRDTVGDWKDQLAYLQSAYGTQLANDQWRAELDEKIREFDLEYALKNRPLGGGGGGVVYVGGGSGKDGKTNDNGVRGDILKNALTNKINADLGIDTANTLYKTPAQHLADRVLVDKMAQATADAINNGEIPNTKQAINAYKEDLTKIARTIITPQNKIK
jgi:hypothetical protein